MIFLIISYQLVLVRICVLLNKYKRFFMRNGMGNSQVKYLFTRISQFRYFCNALNLVSELGKMELLIECSALLKEVGIRNFRTKLFQY